MHRWACKRMWVHVPACTACMKLHPLIKPVLDSVCGLLCAACIATLQPVQPVLHPPHTFVVALPAPWPHHFHQGAASVWGAGGGRRLLAAMRHFAQRLWPPVPQVGQQASTETSLDIAVEREGCRLAQSQACTEAGLHRAPGCPSSLSIKPYI